MIDTLTGLSQRRFFWMQLENGDGADERTVFLHAHDDRPR